MVRTRNKISIDVPKRPYHIRYVDTLHPELNYDYLEVRPEIKGIEVMVDEVTRDFQKVISNGNMVFHDMSRTSTHVSCGDCATLRLVGTRMNDGTSATFTHDGMHPARDFLLTPEGRLLPVAPDVSNWDYGGNAINKAFASAQETSAQLLVDYFERAKTIEMLRSPFKSALRDFQRGKHFVSKGMADRSKSYRKRCYRVGAVDYTRGLASGWMQWRYGLAPTLYSIRDSLAAWDKAMVVSKRRITGRSTMETENSEEFAALSTQSWWSTPYTEAFTGNRTVKTSWRAGCIAEIDCRLTRELGLELPSLPLATWDLVPMSWAVDWWFDVSSWLKAVVPQTGVTVLGSWVTTRNEDAVSVLCNSLGSTNVVGDVINVAHGTGFTTASHLQTTVTRRCGVTPTFFPTVDLRYHSWKHSLDALALIAGRFKLLKKLSPI